MRYLFIALLTSLAVLSAEDEIVVYLETESKLQPIYIAHVQAETSTLAPSYVSQLESVFRNDFALDGTSRLMDTSSERENLAKRAADNLLTWQKAGTTYVIVPSLNQKNFGATLFNTRTGALKQIAGISLSGTLADDRRLLHRLADSLHKEMTGQPGVANTRLLYVLRQPAVGQSKKSSEVWECDYDGANAHRVSPSGEYCVTPSHIPSRGGATSPHYLYVGYNSGQPRIFIGSLNEGAARRVSTAKGNQLMPTLSRQRDKIAFICDLSGTADLYIQQWNPESGPAQALQRLYHAKGATQSTPTFSPDGREIAFTSDRDGSPRVYMMPVPPPGVEPKNPKPKLISKRAINGSAPAWSPDGQKIAFCAMTKGERQIWIYDCTTGDEKQITTGPGHKENPTWASNSLHLVYNSASANEIELYLIDLNRMKPTKIALGKGDKHYPSWQS